MASVNSASGMPLNVGDYVRIPNPTAGQFPAFLIGVVTGVNAGAGTINVTYLTSSGSTASLSGVQASTAHQLAQASGAGNAEVVAFPG